MSLSLENSVLYYIHKHISGSQSNGFHLGCKVIFSNLQIEQAKSLLLQSCKQMLTDINPEITKNVSTSRKSTQHKSKVDFEINDIITMLSTLIASGKTLDISIKDDEFSSDLDIAPASIYPFSVSKRVTSLEEQVGTLNIENKKLTDGNADLNKKYDTLLAKYDEIKELISNLANGEIIVGSPPSTPLPNPASASSGEAEGRGQAQPSSPDVTTLIPITTTTCKCNANKAKLKRSKSVDDISRLSNDISFTPTAATDLSETTSKTKRERKKVNKPISGKQRHEMNVASAKASREATADAMEKGIEKSIALEMGDVAAAATAKTYASIISKTNVNPGNATSRPGATPRQGSGIGQQPGARAQPTPPPNDQPREPSTSGHNTASTNIGITNPKPSSYKRGTAVSQTRSIAAKITRPSHLDNKCLVVSRIGRNTSKEDIKSYVNEIADKEIDIKYLQDITRKDFTKWRTIVLEISPEDYTILSDESIWDPSMGIKEFSGYKYWHNDRRRPTATSPPPNSTVGQSWAA